MRIFSQYAPAGIRCEWSDPSSRGGSPDLSLSVIVGAGRRCTFHGAALPAGIWIPLHGRLQIAMNDGALSVGRGELYISESAQCLQARARGNALWVAILGQRAAWQRLLGEVGDPSSGEPMLLAAQHPAGRNVRQVVIDLVRHALGAGNAEVESANALNAFVSAMADLQAAFDPLIRRCPGRTLAQRRAVFLRLQRVRRHMLVNCHLDLDVDQLARMVSYSSCHFIRAFRTVFGQTPHAALVDYRLQRAHELLGSSELAVSEVALASGFENRCAFSRVFKRRFGVTAVEVRRQGAAFSHAA
jgi:AraC family transcriptional regulator